jgi:hypothetical protein
LEESRAEVRSVKAWDYTMFHTHTEEVKL